MVDAHCAVTVHLIILELKKELIFMYKKSSKKFTGEDSSGIGAS